MAKRLITLLVALLTACALAPAAFADDADAASASQQADAPEAAESANPATPDDGAQGAADNGGGDGQAPGLATTIAERIKQRLANENGEHVAPVGPVGTLIERVEQRYGTLPLDYLKQPASLAEASMANTEAERAGQAQFVQQLHDREEQVAWQLSQVAPEYKEIEALGAREEPALFEFTSVEQVEADNANEDGTLGWWQADWYTAHDWSDVGKQIADMRPGDVVVIDGKPVTVEGKFIWPQESTYMEIMRRVGWDATVLQTCLGDELNIWIVYGR